MSSFFDEIAAKLAQLSGVATPEVSRDELNEFNVRDIQAVRVSEGGGGGGSQPWDEHALGATGSDWDDSFGGTWTFNAGVISQTNDTADGALYFTTARHPGVEYVVEAEVRIPSGLDSGTTTLVVIAAANGYTPSGNGTSQMGGVGVGLQADGSGDGATLGIEGWIDAGPTGTPFPTAIVQDEWHTLRAVVSPGFQVAYLDGVLVCQNAVPYGGNVAAPGPPVQSFDTVALGAVGLADFRNVKVWTQALPA